jgi:hypothetical protein
MKLGRKPASFQAQCEPESRIDSGIRGNDEPLQASEIPVDQLTLRISQEASVVVIPCAAFTDWDWQA